MSDNKHSAINGSSQRIAHLDGWRGISISTVVIGHLIDQRYNAGFNQILQSITRLLSLWAVDIFFVISGFIITKMAIREYISSGRFSVRDFYVRRFFRIVPPFFIFLALAAFAMKESVIIEQYRAVIAAMAFTCNLEYMDCHGIVGHTWSLAYEEQFYIVFAPLFALFAAYARRVFVAILLILLLLPFLHFALGPGDFLQTAARLAPSFSFIGAGAIGAVYEGQIERSSKGNMGGWISSAAAVSVLLILLSEVLVVVPGNSLAGHIRTSLSYVGLPACFLWLIGSSLYQPNLFARILVVRPLLFVGMISYSLYLWQQLFTLPREFYVLENLFVAAPLMAVAAVLSYYLIERPSVRLGKRLLAGVRRQAVGPIAVLEERVGTERQPSAL
jgi:peptidoglycan/LPS O-acetylase OafA/YrhL